MFSKNRSFYNLKAISTILIMRKKSTPSFTQKDKKPQSSVRHTTLSLRSYCRSNFILLVRDLGISNYSLIENVHNQFLRTITGLRKSAPIYILQAELGRYPIDICIYSRMIGFWVSIMKNPGNKVTKILYIFLFNETNAGHMNKWINYINEILISVGKINLFITIISVIRRYISQAYCKH